jgi:LysM repeat protein
MTVSDTISSYRKRRKSPTPIVIGLLAVILVLVGIIILIVGFGGGAGVRSLFATDTPTPTITPSPTNTSTPTETPTVTPTSTNTLTATPSAPYQYVIQQNDYLETIAKDHGLGDNGVVLILLLNPYNATTFTGIDPIEQTIYVGQTIWLPPPGMAFPTPTPWPTNIPAGTKIIYFVLPGDSLGSIALKCNSTIDAIVAANKDVLADGATTVISPGWLLLVPINLVTPVPTAISTATPSLTPTP